MEKYKELVGKKIDEVTKFFYANGFFCWSQHPINTGYYYQFRSNGFERVAVEVDTNHIVEEVNPIEL